MKETNDDRELLPLPFRVVGSAWRVGTHKLTLFVLAATFFYLWRNYPAVSYDQALRIEQQRLLVEQQREEYERERMAILGRVVRESGLLLEQRFSPDAYAVKPTTNQPAETNAIERKSR